jgi:hypothetical protein
MVCNLHLFFFHLIQVEQNVRNARIGFFLLRVFESTCHIKGEVGVESGNFEWCEMICCLVFSLGST